MHYMYLLDCHAMYKNCIECKERIVYREYSEYYLCNHKNCNPAVTRHCRAMLLFNNLYCKNKGISLRIITLSSNMYIKRFVNFEDGHTLSSPNPAVMQVGEQG